MVKKIYVLLIGILLISCENEPGNLLTAGSWILDNKDVSYKETIDFYDNNTYIIHVEFTVATFGFSSGKISGDWMRQNNQILFINSKVDLLDTDIFINGIPIIQGKPLSSFYGYVFRDSIDRLAIPDIAIDRTDAVAWAWTIKALTKKVLIVERNGEMLKYYRE